MKFNVRSFIAANSFITANKQFYPWILDRRSFDAPCLFIGPRGFDVEGFANFTLHATPRKVVSQESACLLLNRKHVKDMIGSRQNECLLLRDFEELNPILAPFLLDFAHGRGVRILGAVEWDERQKGGIELGRWSHFFKGRLVTVPTLFERKEDFKFLTSYIFQCEDSRLSIVADAIDLLREQYWPGDFMQLRAFIKKLLRSTHLHRNNLVSKPVVEALIGNLEECSQVEILGEAICFDKFYEVGKCLGLKTMSSLVEAAMIRTALAQCRGKKVMAARMLRLAPSTLNSKIQALDEYL